MGPQFTGLSWGPVMSLLRQTTHFHLGRHWMLMCSMFVCRTNMEKYKHLHATILIITHIHKWLHKTDSGRQLMKKMILVMWSYPRHSWWRRRQCCGFPVGCHGYSQVTWSGALILQSGMSCPPVQRGRKHLVSVCERETETKSKRKLREWVTGWVFSQCVFSVLSLLMIDVPLRTVCVAVQSFLVLWCINYISLIPVWHSETELRFRC